MNLHGPVHGFFRVRLLCITEANGLRQNIEARRAAHEQDNETSDRQTAFPVSQQGTPPSFW